MKSLYLNSNIFCHPRCNASCSEGDYSFFQQLFSNFFGIKHKNPYLCGQELEFMHMFMQS